MQRNVKCMEGRSKTMFKFGKLRLEDIIVFPADRAQGKIYKQTFQVNNCPTLTTSNVYLFALSVKDVVNDVADEDMIYLFFETNTYIRSSFIIHI